MQQMNAARFHLGVCYYALGDYEAAIYWFEDAGKREQDPARANQWLERRKRCLPGASDDPPKNSNAKEKGR